MTDVKIAVRFGWEAGVDPSFIFALLKVFYNYVLNKVSWRKFSSNGGIPLFKVLVIIFKV
ncbi:hypothetical protein JCM15765_18080 [Paradesulfitobacterium aromaticivorans]